MEESSQLVEEIRAELGSLDERVQALKPGAKLDTLENRCMWSVGMAVWEWEYRNEYKGLIV